MSIKQPQSPQLVSNPYIKKRNLDWELSSPAPTKRQAWENQRQDQKSDLSAPIVAPIKADEEKFTDHLSHFKTHLAYRRRILTTTGPPQLTISSYATLYEENFGHAQGSHFIIHQHDHPIAGTHYDLRLQINETSSASWAIMYGLPGDPNSVRLNRNATETRVHCLWNHLVETASFATGSLLIWDTGTYSILPRRSKHAPADDPTSPPSSPLDALETSPTQQSLLQKAFHNRKIRLQLHGSKLPNPYVVNLRLTKSDDRDGRVRSAKVPKTRRQRGGVRTKALPLNQPADTSDDNGSVDDDDDEQKYQHPSQTLDSNKAGVSLSAMERELRELEDEEVRKLNAYPGAINSIGSIHQRRWYLSLDRRACGFKCTKRNGRKVWEAADATETSKLETMDEQQENLLEASRLSYPFYVRGADEERSVVTARTGGDILLDEEVIDFIPRKGWLPVLK